MLTIVMLLSLGACGNGEDANVLTTTLSKETEPQPLTSLATADDTEENQILSGAAVALEFLRGYLKNPHSLEVYSIQYKYTHGSHFYKITYSATNDFGGRIEGVKYVRTSTAKFDYSTAQSAKEGDETVKKYYESDTQQAKRIDADKALELCLLVFG